MKLLLLALIFVVNLSAQLTAITGTFKAPDGALINGQVIIRLTRSTATNMCGTPVQVITFKTVYVRITNGTLGTLNLYATRCLCLTYTGAVCAKTAPAYDVEVQDSRNQTLYRSRWTVPNTGKAYVSDFDFD